MSVNIFMQKKVICSLQIHNQLSFNCEDILCYSPYMLTCNVNGADLLHHMSSGIVAPVNP